MTDIRLDTKEEILAALKSLGFDSYTFEGAVMAFQYSRKITVDGVFGPETRKQLELALQCP